MTTLKAYGDDLFTRLVRKELGMECVRELTFCPGRRWRFDYALPTYRIALEVEGGVWRRGRHTRPEGFLKDIEKYNTAAVMGWRVLRCTPDTLLTVATLDMLRAAIKTEIRND